MHAEIQGKTAFAGSTVTQDRPCAHWDYWSAQLPLCQEGSPAKWLDNDFLLRRGIYILTLPRPEGGQRLLHVGCVYGKHTTLRDRTLDHLNNYHAFSWNTSEKRVRRLDRLPEYDRKSGKILSYTNNASSAEVNDFLATIRVIYLAPGCRLEPNDPLLAEQVRTIKQLEGAIVRAAAHAYGDEDQLSNTVSRTHKCDNATQFAEPINNLPGIGPLFP